MLTIITLAGDRVTASPKLRTVADLAHDLGHDGPMRLNGWEIVEHPRDCPVPLDFLEEVTLLTAMPLPLTRRGWRVPIGGGWMMVCASCAPICVEYEDVAGQPVERQVHACDIDGAEPCDVALCDICDHAP